jgi:hypothetical protein
MPLSKIYTPNILRTSENKVLRRILGLIRKEIKG